MKERFEGEVGRRRLIQALMAQKMVANNAGLAEEITGLVDVEEVAATKTLICQGAADNDIYLILAGSPHFAPPATQFSEFL